MIILGNVRNVSTVAAEIELPGRIYGYISIGAISDILTHKVQKRLGGEGQGKEDVGFIISHKESIFHAFPF